jgi:endonuclease/exonuclease/phosphatase family metal-dependent hydrolase
MSKKKKIITIVSVILVLAIGITLCATLLPDRLQGKLPEDKVFGFAEKPADAVRIMSFNVRCTNVGARSMRDRVPDVVTTILNGMPDSLGVQEATPEWIDTLNEELGKSYAYVGEGRDGEHDGEYSAIFYLKDKYNVVDSGTFWLSETPDKVSFGWDAVCRRICTWAILENKENGERYIHMNSHFDHVGEEARSQSIKMIVEKAKEYKDIPAVFTADMNVPEGSKNYKEIAENSIFKDTKYTAKNANVYVTYHDRYPEKDDARVIDYCFANEGFEAINYGVVTESPSKYYVSDHFPLYADLVIVK